MNRVGRSKPLRSPGSYYETQKRRLWFTDSPVLRQAKPLGIRCRNIAVAGSQVPAALTVQGIGGTSATLSVSDLSKLPQQIPSGTPQPNATAFRRAVCLGKMAVWFRDRRRRRMISPGDWRNDRSS
jgi:hypothetical protein